MYGWFPHSPLCTCAHIGLLSCDGLGVCMGGLPASAISGAPDAGDSGGFGAWAIWGCWYGGWGLNWGGGVGYGCWNAGWFWKAETGGFWGWDWFRLSLNIQKRRPAIAMAARGPTTAPAIQALLLGPTAGLGVGVDMAVDSDVGCGLVELRVVVVEIEVVAVVVAVIERIS